MRAEGVAGRASPGASRPFDPETLAAGLADGIQELALELPAAAPGQLLQYLELLARWNAVYNLTSVREPRDMLSVHLLDSLSIVPLIDALAPASILDVGSGAGLPSIPLAVARPTIEVRSVDAVAKKIGFQWQVKAALSLKNLHPLHHRVETLAATPVSDVIVSRAFSDLSAMLASVESLAGASTTVVAMKGAEPATELAALPAGWRVEAIRQLDVPFLGARRCAVVLRRST